MSVAPSSISEVAKPSVATARDGYCIVMTACIDPSTGPHAVARSKVETRLADYREALDFWLKHPDSRLNRIVFIDNSGYPLQSLRTFAEQNDPLGKSIEFISLNCNYSPPGLSYGYAEFAMLDLGLPQSRLAAASKYWIKVTGRLRFTNVSKLLDRLPDNTLFAVDCRDNTRFVKTPQVFATTQFMLLRSDFFEQQMYGVKDDMTAPCIENFVYDRLIKFRGQPGAILRWPVNVDPIGIAGGNKNYGSLKQRGLNLARAICRRVFPNWWV